jgi:hypothetical protein
MVVKESLNINSSEGVKVSKGPLQLSDCVFELRSRVGLDGNKKEGVEPN